MIHPDQSEYNLGETIHKQPLRLVHNKTTGGQEQWVLCRDEANQRDDRVFIAGLTREVLLRIAEIVS